MSKFKTVKLFDSQDMPREYFEYIVANKECSNGAAIKWYIGDWQELDEGVHADFGKEFDGWLKKQGATDNEMVLIYIWW